MVFHLVYHLNIPASPVTGLPQIQLFFVVLVLNRQMVEHLQVLKKEKYETSQTAKYAKFSPVFFEQANLYFLENIFKSFLSLLALEKQFP